jgi:hypothetical protein
LPSTFLYSAQLEAFADHARKCLEIDALGVQFSEQLQEGREARPGLDALMKALSRREIEWCWPGQ